MTPRENEIKELIQRRFSNKEIASILKICESTVKFHLTNIFSKLHAHGRQDLLQRKPIESSLGGLLLQPGAETG